MNVVSRVQSILRADPVRWHALAVVQALNLPDSWIGAGFVRTIVWNHLHGRPSSPLIGDVDVIWYCRGRTEPEEDRRIQASLYAAAPSVDWSVKNQARMHLRNGDPPYASSTDAMRHWPETATAVAIRRLGSEDCEIAAPFGLDDLLNLILRPTPGFVGDKRGIYEERIETKNWKGVWPLLQEADA